MSSYNLTYHDLEVTCTLPKTSVTCKANVHYIQGGNPDLPKIVLLHGFPSSSQQYKDFMLLLADSYHVLAPDYPGFGLTKVAEDFAYSFENITEVTAAWLRALAIKEAAIFIQDFGAPVGLRLAITGGIKPTAILSQNGNAYKVGLGPTTFGLLGKWWESGSDEIRKKIQDNMLTLEGTKTHIVKGTPDKDLALIDPQHWTLAYVQNIAGPTNAASKLAFLYDYRTNVELYPAFQTYFRDSKVPILATWGKNDPSFIPEGAEAFRDDSPDAEIHLLDAGHFALETVRWEIARLVKQFLLKVGYT